MIGGWIVEVNDPRLCTANPAFVVSVLDIYPVDEHAMELTVARLQRSALRPSQLAEGVFQRIYGQFWVEAGERVVQ